MHSGRWCGHAYAVGRRTRLHFWCAYARGACGANGSGHAYAVGRRTRLHFWCAYACGSNGPNGLGCLCMWFWCAYACGSNGPNLLVCICMWLQRPQRSWLLMHVAPTVFLRRLGCYAYAVRSCICPRVTLDKKVPTFLLCICRALAAYARG